jgi:hypothetical protein
MGRLNSSTVDYWISEDGLILLEAWSRDGLKLGQIADNMGIRQAKLSQWRKEYEEIDEALKSGKEVVDYKVENALLKAALGFKTKEITVTIGRRQINGEWVDITKETKEKEIAPSVTACLAWLNNRKPNTWKRNRDNVVEVDDEDNDVRITIIRGKGSDLDDDVNVSATIDQNDIKREKQKLEKQKEDEWEGWENW